MCIININIYYFIFFFFSSRRRHTRSKRDWSSDVCSSDLNENISQAQLIFNRFGDKSAINKEKENSAKKDIYHEDLEYINSLDDYSGEDEIVYQDIYEEIEENDDIDKLNDKKSFIGKVKELLGLSED